MKNDLNTVDTLGALLAQIADLEKQADAIKADLKDAATTPNGTNTYEGMMFKATQELLLKYVLCIDAMSLLLASSIIGSSSVLLTVTLVDGKKYWVSTIEHLSSFLVLRYLNKLLALSICVCCL